MRAEHPMRSADVTLDRPQVGETSDSHETTASRDSVAIRLSRTLLYTGLFLSSLLIFRVSGTTYGDVALLTSALILSLAGPAGIGHRTSGAAWIAIALIIVGGGLASYRATDIGSNGLVALRMIYLVGVLPWQFRRLLVSERSFLRANRVWAAGAAVCCLGTVLQASGGALVPGMSVTNAGRYTGFTQHVSDIGGIGGIGAAYFLAVALSRTGRTRLGALAGVCACGIGLLLSGSVSGMLALSCAVLYLLLRGRVHLGRLSVAFGGVALAFAFAGSVQRSTVHALDPIERIKQVFGDSPETDLNSSLDTSATRWGTDKLGFQGFMNHLLMGRGLDGKSSVVEPYSGLTVHNLVLAALYGGGLLFGIGVLIPTLQALYLGWRFNRTNPTGTEIYAAYIACLVFAMTGPSVFNRYYWIPLSFVIVYAQRKPLSSRRRHPVGSIVATSKCGRRAPGATRQRTNVMLNQSTLTNE